MREEIIQDLRAESRQAKQALMEKSRQHLKLQQLYDHTRRQFNLSGGTGAHNPPPNFQPTHQHVNGAPMFGGAGVRQQPRDRRDTDTAVRQKNRSDQRSYIRHVPIRSQNTQVMQARTTDLGANAFSDEQSFSKDIDEYTSGGERDRLFNIRDSTSGHDQVRS